jgi:hypothetical protein
VTQQPQTPEPEAGPPASGEATASTDDQSAPAAESTQPDPESTAAVPVVPPPPWLGAPAASPDDASGSPDGGAAVRTNDRPEIAIGAAFAGGFALALILRRLAR